MSTVSQQLPRMTPEDYDASNKAYLRTDRVARLLLGAVLLLTIGLIAWATA